MDLYFAGSDRRFDDELKRLNCNVLLSNFADRPKIRTWVDFIKETGYLGKFFVDSGAYSVYHQNKPPLSTDDYINFLNEIGEYIEVFAQLDTIINPNLPQKEKEACEEKTWQNYLYMYDRLKPSIKDKLIPLYHAGENIDRFYNLLEYTHEDGSHIKYIGLGAPQGVFRSVREAYYAEWFNIIKKSSNPNVKTHAFGCTDLATLESFPFTSADSASWVRSSAAGNILVDNKWISISSRRSDLSARFSAKSAAAKEYVESYVSARGYSVEQLQTDPISIYVYNINYLKNWADSYVYKPSSALEKIKISLF